MRCILISRPSELVLDEAGSDIAATLWNACDVALSSRLALQRNENGSGHRCVRSSCQPTSSGLPVRLQ
jgi:hypothetical protein